MSSTKAIGVRIEPDVILDIKQYDYSFVLSEFVRCALRDYRDKLHKEAVHEVNRRYMELENKNYLNEKYGQR